MIPLKILIIEDELITATSIQEALETDGHEVTAIARSLREVKQALDRQMPDLALVDIWLENSPHSGIDIVQKLLKSHSLPFIYLTSQSSASLVEEAQKTSPAAYMLKPFRRRELTIQIELAYLNHSMQANEPTGSQSAESLFLPTKQGKEHVRILKKDVVYLLAAGAYVEVHVHTGEDLKSHVFSMNLGYLEQFFPAYSFYRLSRSLMINLDFVERIEKNQLYVSVMEKPIIFPESQHRDLLRKLAVVRTP